MATEEKVSGEKLVDRVKELVKEGNARRIIVKNEVADGGYDPMFVSMAYLAERYGGGCE